MAVARYSVVPLKSKESRTHLHPGGKTDWDQSLRFRRVPLLQLWLWDLISHHARRLRSDVIPLSLSDSGSICTCCTPTPHPLLRCPLPKSTHSIQNLKGPWLPLCTGQPAISPAAFATMMRQIMGRKAAPIYFYKSLNKCWSRISCLCSLSAGVPSDLFCSAVILAIDGGFSHLVHPRKRSQVGTNPLREKAFHVPGKSSNDSWQTYESAPPPL